MSSTAPVQKTLRGALDGLEGGDADALLKLQANLIDAKASRLARLEPGSERPEDASARRAVREGRIVVDRRDDAVEIAAPIGGDRADQLVAVHRLSRATPMVLALAEERLELTAALFRARSGGGGEWDSAAELATAFATAATPADAWTAAAKVVQRLADARRVILARLNGGRVRLVADSAGEAPSSELLATIRLAAGEAYDIGEPLGGGEPPAPALRAIAGGQPLSVRLAESGDRAVVVMAMGAASPDVLQPAVSLLVALKPPARTLLPQKLIYGVARGLPIKSEDPAVRRRVARRAILAAPLLLLLVPIPDTVGAPATIEALDRRVVTAPFDGRIESVLAEPGDRVRGGQTVLARLDSRAAQSERADVLAGLQAALSQAGTSRTEGRGDEARQAQLQAQQLAARAQALALQIGQAEVRAPIDGVLGGDDLRRRIGAPVSRGETLFVVAKPGRYRVEARVSDRSIASVEPGQRIALALRARVLSRPMATVTRIYPLSEVVQGDNIFRVIGEIDAGDGGALLPGMEGRASIRTGWVPLGWAVLKGPVRWVRQTLWV